ncbi:MAG: DUF948 domain-containing protein [Dissulfurispiraceae bacterium]
MINQAWLIILSVSFFVMTLTFVAVIFFLVIASIEMKKAAVSLRDFLKSMEERLAPVIDSSQQTLGSIKKVGDDLGTVTQNVREVSEALIEISSTIRALSCLINELQGGLSLRVAGVRAGIKTAMDVLMSKKKEGRS